MITIYLIYSIAVQGGSLWLMLLSPLTCFLDVALLLFVGAMFGANIQIGSKE